MKQITGAEFIKSFESWYKKNFISLFNFVAYRVPNINDVEDICSTVCEKALRKHNQYDPSKGTLSNWIFAIARNCIKNHYREQSREQSKSTPLGSIAELDLVDSSSSPEINSEEKEPFLKVVEAIKLLSTEEQTIVALRYGVGFSYIEIAKQLNILLSTVGVSLYRSHKKLKAIIKLEEAKNGV